MISSCVNPKINLFSIKLIDLSIKIKNLNQKTSRGDLKTDLKDNFSRIFNPVNLTDFYSRLKLLKAKNVKLLEEDLFLFLIVLINLI